MAIPEIKFSGIFLWQKDFCGNGIPFWTDVLYYHQRKKCDSTLRTAKILSFLPTNVIRAALHKRLSQNQRFWTSAYPSAALAPHDLLCGGYTTRRGYVTKFSRVRLHIAA